MTSPDVPHVAIGAVREGIVEPQIPLKSYVDARLQFLQQLQDRADTLVTTQASTLAGTVEKSATALSQRVEAAASQQATAVEQTRASFEKRIDELGESSRVGLATVIREVELRDHHTRQLEALRETLHQERTDHVKRIVDLATSSHAAEHDRIREISTLAESVRADKDASQNEWRRTIENLVQRAVTIEVLESKLDSVVQRIDLSERTAEGRADISMRETGRRLTQLEAKQNQNAGGRASLLAASSIMISVAGVITGVILFLVLHH